MWTMIRRFLYTNWRHLFLPAKMSGRMQRFMAPAIGVLTISASLLTWWVLTTDEQRNLDRQIHSFDEVLQSYLDDQVSYRFRMIENLARSFEFRGEPGREAKEAILQLTRRYRSILEVRWLDKNGTTLWTGMGQFGDTNKEIKQQLKEKMEESSQFRAGTSSGLIPMPDGSSAVVYVAPAVKGDKILGYVGAIFDFGRLILDITERIKVLGYYLEVMSPDESYPIFKSYSEEEFEELDFRNSVTGQIVSVGAQHTYRLIPSVKMRPGSVLPKVVLGFGFLLGLLCSLLFFVVQVSLKRLDALADSNVRLELEIRARQQIEQALLDAKKDAEVANEAKSTFIAHMTHEIRTPLGVIMGFTELLNNEKLTHEDRSRYAEAIRRNGESLLAIVNEVLDLARVESGRLELELEPIHLQSFVQEVATFLEIKAREKGIQLRVEWGGPIPEHIETDPTRLRQVLVNIIGNAIKFTEKGHVTLRTDAVVDQNKVKVRFTVTDTGCGIAPQHQTTIFQPFTQADRFISRQFGGTGLGLSLARKLANRLGGDVTLLSSRTDEGSVFQAVIEGGLVPAEGLITPQATAVLAQSHVRDELRSSVDLRGVRILLVDDCEDNQQLFKTFLTSCGAEVGVAGDGEEGYIKAIRQGPWHVVFMDMQMPRKNGYETTTELRRDGFSIPIIALTAHAMKGEKERCLNAGCTDYMAKPVSLGELSAKAAAHAHANVSRPDTEPKQVVTVVGATKEDFEKSGELESKFLGFLKDQSLRPVVLNFVHGLERRIENMSRAVDTKDWSAIRREAHQLKGTSGSIGLMGLSQIAGQLEKAVSAEQVIEESYVSNCVANLDKLARTIVQSVAT